jgi:hypothetical protein
MKLNHLQICSSASGFFLNGLVNQPASNHSANLEYLGLGRILFNAGD